MAKQLVIGCGYLGDRIAHRWARNQHEVYATTRREERANEMRQLGWHPIVMDVTQPDTIPDLPEAHTVVYCVGLDRGAGKPMREVYVDGLANVLDHLPGPDRFIYVSSTGVYGQNDGESVDETSVTEPTSESGQVVLDAEKLVRERIPDSIILRFAGIYGPGRILMAEALLRGDPIRGNPEQWLNLIHVDDGVSAVLAAEEVGQPGQTYNISDGNAVTRREFYERVAETINAPTLTFSPGPSIRGGHRRILNDRLIQELKVSLSFPDYRAGLQNAAGELNAE